MSDKEYDKRIDALARTSASLERRAWRLNVDIPASWWENDDDLNIERGASPDQLEFIRRRWLTDEGQERLKFRIQEAEEQLENARLDRRHKRLAFYQMIFSLLFGLTGWIVGLIALITRS